MPRKSRLGQTNDPQRNMLLPFMRDYPYLRTGQPVLPDVEQRWKKYQTEFENYGQYSSYGMQEHEGRIDNSYYLGSVLSAKTDPLGRYVLMDLRTSRSDSYRPKFKYLTLALTGAKSPTVFGGVYWDRDERDQTKNGDYYRQHGGPGARVQRTGLGAALYPGSALACAMTNGASGTHSPRTGSYHNRTRAADKLWDAMVQSGLAYTETGGGSTESGSMEHCVYVSGDSITGSDRNGDDVEATITSDHVCGDVDYEYDASVEEDFLDATTIFDNTPLFVWSSTGAAGRRPFFMDSRYEFDVKANAYKQIAATPGSEPDITLLQIHHGVDDVTSDDYVFPKIKTETAEMLAAAYHGGSPQLIFDIATVLRKSGSEDLMVNYLRRLDIANAMQAHPELMNRYLELLGQQRLPGIGRVSLAGINEVRSVHRGVRLGQLKADPTSDNPLHVPVVSSRTQKKLAKFPVD